MTTKQQKYRLITRNDFDGVVCAMIFKELNLIRDVLFTHPQEIQNKNIKITENDIIANLPYHEKAFLNFDNHDSELLRIGRKRNFILDTTQKSVAKVVFNYFNLKDNIIKNFLHNDTKEKIINLEAIEAVERLKEGSILSINDIIKPEGWFLFSILMDARTNLERYIGDEINEDKFNICVEFIKSIQKQSIQDFLEHNVGLMERQQLLNKQKNDFEKQIKNNIKIENNIAILDLHNEKEIYVGNRFYVFTLLDDNIEFLIHLINGHNTHEITISIRKNPFYNSYNSNNINIGYLLHSFGGGGTSESGTCQINIEEFKDILPIIQNKLQH